MEFQFNNLVFSRLNSRAELREIFYRHSIFLTAFSFGIHKTRLRQIAHKLTKPVVQLLRSCVCRTPPSLRSSQLSTIETSNKLPPRKT